MNPITKLEKRRQKIIGQFIIVKWKPVPGWHGKYEVSNTGLIRNRESGIILKGFSTPSGHRVIQFYVSSCVARGKRKQIHKIYTRASLVMRAFVGQRPYGTILRYLDGDRTNCSIENLVYMRLGPVQKSQPKYSRYRPKK